ncbi:GntR family transcriptional regulator [Devosia sp. XJ19-1]|uniref:GntR family transcriptional regulator n=1 Tax=Devosia ureilytica TaxID=2952754 RepID=A0A9Q4FSV6_9HYPH|nr:GntR family transcriptional regulator [Devosia ureilytica]MCP8884114.1 GntR family transcriptional regulator [Devosia ureilytica]MCP8887722.1 GntR family transcriptional regulator [Devosia ureilytica]
MTLDFPTSETAESAAASIEKDLRRAIVELEMPPGMRLSEQDIATRLGVSRQPVREAMIRLANSRLIEIRPHRGTVVARISASEMTEALFVRQSVENSVVERAAQSFDPWQRKRIETLIAQQEIDADKLDHAGFREHDEAFHIAIAKGAGVGIAWIAIADMKSHMDRVCNLTLQTEADMKRRVREHRAIMAAIDARDVPAARAAMAEHLSSILDHLPVLETKHASLFV